MGWDWKAAFDWFKKEGLTPYMCTTEWFIHCLNGTTAEMLTKCYDRIREQIQEIDSLKQEIKNLKKLM